MSKILKIAIPSDDGLTVKTSLCSSRGYVVTTIISGVIIHQEMRWNLLSEIMTACDGRYYNLHDCTHVIFHVISERRREILTGKGIEVLLTDNNSVNVALADFLATASAYEHTKQIA
jgi:hypothetical protein